ncbi:MAG: YtxH domain-containing protein [Proteobacteria bacterium]|nr:YtxH domain-containing protein [Pseudomonadota bacterium]
MGHHDEGFSSGAVAFSFLSGALLGAGLAFLLTPQPGDETRRMIRGYAKKAEDDIYGIAKDARGNVENVVEQGKDLFEEGKKLLGSAYESGKEAVRRKKEQFTAGEAEQT